MCARAFVCTRTPLKRVLGVLGARVGLLGVCRCACVKHFNGSPLRDGVGNADGPIGSSIRAPGSRSRSEKKKKKLDNKNT